MLIEFEPVLAVLLIFLGLSVIALGVLIIWSVFL